MSTQQSERVSHDRAVSFSSRGLSYSYIHKGIIITYVQRKKKRPVTLENIYIIYFYSSVQRENVYASSTTSIITFMCQQLSFVVSFLSWVNEKKQQLTGAIHACKCRQSYLIFIQKQTSKIIELKFQLTNIWGNCSYNHNNTHSNMAENCTNYFSQENRQLKEEKKQKGLDVLRFPELVFRWMQTTIQTKQLSTTHTHTLVRTTHTTNKPTSHFNQFTRNCYPFKIDPHVFIKLTILFSEVIQSCEMWFYKNCFLKIRNVRYFCVCY